MLEVGRDPDGARRRDDGSRACAIMTDTCLAPERGLAGQEEVGDRSQRIDVAARSRPQCMACSGDMYRGEPVIVPCCESCIAGALPLGQPEVEELGHVVETPAVGGEDVGRLDVAVDQAQAVRLAERLARLPKQVDHPLRRSGPWRPTSSARLRPGRYSMT